MDRRCVLPWCAAAVALFSVAVPARSQETRPGQVAGSSVGEVGQRQARERPINGIQPMARIDSRIQDRVQSRIRNRIDRDYDPTANAASPFAVADRQVRTAGRPSGR